MNYIAKHNFPHAARPAKRGGRMQKPVPDRRRGENAPCRESWISVCNRPAESIAESKFPK